MHIEEFSLERIQSLYENTVSYNLTESGLHPYSLREILTVDEQAQVLEMPLHYGQTNGDDVLRSKLAELYSRPECPLSEKNILVTNGTAEANFLATWALLNADDHAIVVLPNYMQIPGLARSLGVGISHVYLKEDESWRLDLDEVERQITNRTKAVFLCNPNNPTGQLIDPEQRARLVNIAAKNDLWIYCDEIYIGSELEGEETQSLLGLNAYDRIIVSSGLSKSYGLAGLRIGWTIAPEKFIEKLWSHRDYTSICSPLISQKVAALILTPERRSALLKRGRQVLRQNLAYLTEWTRAYGDDFSFVAPQAGGMAFVKYGYDINSSLLSQQLRREKSVFILPGDCFGLDGYLRLGIGQDPHIFQKGLELFGEFINKHF